MLTLAGLTTEFGITPRLELHKAPERIGGVYVYDVANPAAPSFQQYAAGCPTHHFEQSSICIPAC
jgi:hypothetical protein